MRHLRGPTATIDGATAPCCDETVRSICSSDACGVDAYIAIAAVSGAAVGGVLVWLVMRARLGGYHQRLVRADRERRHWEGRAGELVTSSRELVDGAVRAMGQIGTRAQGVLGERSAADEALVTRLDRLIHEGLAPVEMRADLLGEAARAGKAIGEGTRALAEALEPIQRRTELVHQILDHAGTDSQGIPEKVEALQNAATQALTAASAMDDAMRGVQEGAAETAALSARVSEEADRGYQAVHRTLDEIERIRALTAAGRARIEALRERVSGIGHVLRVIHDITEKTNLLALNASIIAAQSGEHGRSFAVVAHEIKVLAQRTSASTKEIGERIRSVQEESERAVTAMADGVAAVGGGFEVTVAAGDALDAVRNTARHAQKRVQQMTRSLREQNTATQQLVTNAALVSECASSFAQSARGQSSLIEDLRATTLEIQSGAQQVAAVVRQHAGSFGRGAETASEFAKHLVEVGARHDELRRLVAGVRDEIVRGRTLSEHLATHWNSLHDTSERLRKRLDGLQEV